MIYLTVNTEGPHAKKARQNLGQPVGDVVTHFFSVEWIDTDTVYTPEKGDSACICLGELGGETAKKARYAIVTYAKRYGICEEFPWGAGMRVDFELQRSVEPNVAISKPAGKLVFM